MAVPETYREYDERGRSQMPDARPATSGEIVGASAAFNWVLRQVQTAANTNVAVLLQGETGTGKEILAQRIHNLSSRRSSPFVAMNCPAIPAALLESDLFGHERGAFTALSSQIRRFQLADRGTLYLDELGDLPPELQPKLLHVLQKQEFERLGSPRTIRVDIRIIVVTNRDLLTMVRDGRFRADLYYRLSVFRITLPPLRSRREDIPELVQHFVRKFSRQLNKRIDCVPSEVTTALTFQDWPGNIRELENFVERSVILSPGTVLRPALSELHQLLAGRSPLVARNLEVVEREHIRKPCARRGVIGGRHGSAAKLGLPRTPLVIECARWELSRSLRVGVAEFARAGLPRVSIHLRLRRMVLSAVQYLA